MSSESENGMAAGKYSNKKKGCKKCCQMGLHPTKNGTCIQAMRPFSSFINTSQHAFHESEFVKVILGNKTENPSTSFEDNQTDALDIDSIIHQLETCFER